MRKEQENERRISIADDIKVGGCVGKTGCKQSQQVNARSGNGA